MKKLRISIPPLLSVLCLLGTTSCDQPGENTAAEQEYEQLITDYIEAWKAFYPSSAARMGLDQYQSQAEDRSDESVQGWLELNNRVLDRISAAPSDLSMDLRIDLRLLRKQAASELTEEESGFPLGRERYAEELLRYYDIELTPEDLAERALREIEEVRNLIAETSGEYWREGHAGEPMPTDILELVTRVSGDMEENRPSTQQESLEIFTRFAEEAEAFVRDREIATLPSDRTLEIVLTPESAGPAARIGFVNSAPSFDPDPMTVLSLPTIPDSFPEEEKEDFYRSFNNHFNKAIIIHELFPGHYMQQKIASGNPRQARVFFPYQPYVEGWATLVEKIALDAGWDDHDKLTYLAHLRKRLENANRAYMSVQVHCFGWTEEQVGRFSEEEALLAPQFAKSLFGRLQRGPMQMTSYFMGKEMFGEVLDAEKERLGDGFKVRTFSDVVLNAGAVPMDMLPSLLASEPSGRPGTGSQSPLGEARDGVPQSADILITGGTVITMDAERRVLENAAIAIVGDRIAAVGPTEELEARFEPREVIDARRNVVMPGLIDGHGHAGHGLVKSLGTDTGEWYGACETIYVTGSTEEFWRADALLTAVERLKFGVTTGLTFFGGGDSVMRTDDPRYGDAYLQAIQDVGVRWFLAVGPRRPPFPRTYAHWEGDSRQDVQVSFEQLLETTETLIQRWHGKSDGRINLAVMFPTHHPENGALSETELQDLIYRTQATRELSREYGLLFTQDGHARGTVKFAHEELGILGPDALLSHATELTEEEIQICRQTDTRIVHNPSAIASIRGRCPVPELLDAGVTVMLGSDGVAPDRSYDMFRHIFQAMRYHRRHFRDPDVLPPGKVLEMATIDAARALGMEDEIGSLEQGKKADIILIDMFQPHLYPMNMPLYRVAYFANGNDVETVIVNGQVLMSNREVRTVNEADVLELAQRELGAALERTGLEHLVATPEGFWGRSRFPR